MWFFGDKGSATRPFAFEMATVTDAGLVRRENQDAYLALPVHGFFCVADGMGGGQGGALASRWLCDELAAVARTDARLDPPARLAQVEETLQRVNARIRAHADEKGYRMMGTTLAAVVFDPALTGKAKIVHVGDSRVYLLRKGVLEPLTRDHTVGNELSRMVTNDRATESDLKSRRNPLTHILTRAVGTELRVRAESRTVETRRGDRFILCTDGVHDLLSDADLLAFFRRGAPAASVAKAADAIRAAGATDNFTLVCFDVV